LPENPHLKGEGRGRGFKDMKQEKGKRKEKQEKLWRKKK